jgi:sugar phosphate isomerase/epimerase
MAKMNISVQLYTLRDATATELPGVLKSLQKIGFAGAELAGYGNLKSAADVKKAFDDAGLKVSGSHTGLDRLEKDLDKVIDDSKTLGNKNVILPYLADDRRTDAAAWRSIAGLCNDIGQKLADAGLTLCYHNHAFEFEEFDGKAALDILWEHSDPKLLKAELDMYWIRHAGLDPVAYLRKVGSRCNLVHLKDMEPGDEKRFAPVGTGILDFKAISDTAAEVGVEWGVVEQDKCYDRPPLESVELSFRNLQKLGIA